MNINLNFDVKIVDSCNNPDAIASVKYPDEINGSIILLTKGMNTIELSEAIHHEIGHIFDWYLSNGKQSKDINIREKNAEIIGESIRFRESS